MYPAGQYPPVPAYPYYPPMPMPNIPMPNAMISAYKQRFPHAPYMWYPQGPPNFMAPPPLHGVPSSSQASRFHQIHPVWEYFELWKEPAEPYSETMADCKLCGRRFPRASTATAKGHLSGNHRPEFLKVCEAEPGHRHHYGPFGRPRAVPTTAEMKGQGSRTENAMLQSTSVFHPAMDEYKIQEYVNSAPVNAQRFEPSNLPAVNDRPFDHANFPGVSIRPYEFAGLSMRPYLFNDPPSTGHRPFEPTIFPPADIKLVGPANYLPVNIKPLEPTTPLPNGTKQFKPNSLSTVNTRLFDPTILPPFNKSPVEPTHYAPANTEGFDPANPVPIDTKQFASPDLLYSDKKLFSPHNLPPIDTKSFGESKPRSSVQMSPISMDSPASPRFFKIEAKLEAEEMERKAEPKINDEEMENLLKMFTKRHDGFYECNLSPKAQPTVAESSPLCVELIRPSSTPATSHLKGLRPTLGCASEEKPYVAKEAKPIGNDQLDEQKRRKIHRGHPVWQYFRLWHQPELSRSSSNAFCKLCRKFTIPYAKARDAQRHLKNIHPEEYKKIHGVAKSSNIGRRGKLRNVQSVATTGNSVKQQIVPSALEAALELIIVHPVGERLQEEPPSPIKLDSISTESAKPGPIKRRKAIRGKMNLLRLFTRRDDELYDCNQCTFRCSYDLNALRAHQSGTHRIDQRPPIATIDGYFFDSKTYSTLQ
ncbi:unnamed protein product, partial [Mesorhabditis spiculigera]